MPAMTKPTTTTTTTTMTTTTTSTTAAAAITRRRARRNSDELTQLLSMLRIVDASAATNAVGGIDAYRLCNTIAVENFFGLLRQIAGQQLMTVMEFAAARARCDTRAPSSPSCISLVRAAQHLPAKRRNANLGYDYSTSRRSQYGDGAPVARQEQSQSTVVVPTRREAQARARREVARLSDAERTAAVAKVSPHSRSSNLRCRSWR